MTGPISTKEARLASLRAARENVERAIAGLGEETLAEPVFEPWAAKDLLGHMASWAEVALSDVERLARGHLPVLAGFNPAEVDDWNRVLMRGRTAFPAAQARGEYGELRQALEKALARLPEAQFSEGSLAGALCDLFAGHEEHHAEALREWRAVRGL